MIPTPWRLLPRILLALALGGAAQPLVAQTAPDDARERQAMERFLGILEKAPRRGTALDRVYGYHVERGTLDTFIKAYQDRTRKDPKDGVAWMILGLVESQRGRDAAAVAALRQAEQARPDDPMPPYYLGQALVLVGQPDAAAEAFERAIARKPGRSELLEVFQALGRVHQRAHRTAEALAVWDRLEKLFPDDLRVQEQIAAALAEESEPERALPRYEALAKKATDPYRRVQFRLDAAELKVRLGRRAEALADFESLLVQLNPESWLYREVRRKVEDVFLKNDDQAGLAAYYEAWLKKNPDDVEAMARLGRTLASQGRVAEAQAWFDKAVKLAPSRKELRVALVEQLVQEKKFAEAAKQYEQMAAADPSNPDTIREWGRMILRDASRPEAERKRAAAAVWRKLVEKRPDDAATAVQVADLLRGADLPDEAIALYKKAIELAPEAAQYREYLGEYYHALKRPEEALATWRQIASGKNRNAKNLGRLAEVLAGFGYKKEALGPIAEACALAADDFDLNFKYAALLHQVERFDDALKQLDVAAPLADSDEQAEAVLEEQVKNYQATHTLSARAEALKKELEAGKDATAARWRRLARLLEVDQKLDEATAAVRKSLAMDDRAIPTWVAAARIFEATGDLGSAAGAQHRLADLDRRARVEHLKEVAKLEGRLGRRDEAMKAGRELLAASPGNPESYQFFADLCFQVGRTEEGLDALRRAVRVNPADSKAMLTLAETLAEQYRTDEAIELFWRAFDAAADLDGKLGVVSRLTNLYLQRNQFDRLVARLELQRREAGAQRDLSICLAAAYADSGDYGTARSVLERLLASNARDTGLLGQLSALAETEGDVEAAARFQRQLNAIAPTDEGKVRLAELYVRAGEVEDAVAIWSGLAGSDKEPARVLQAIDHLMAQSKPDRVLAITGRLLAKDPDDWEVLYREGLALAKSEGRAAEAARRFRALLALRRDDDEPSLTTKLRGRRPAARQPGVVARPTSGPPIPPRDRVQSVWQVRLATGLDPREVYGGSFSWSPADFGQARMAAASALLALAQKEGKADEFLKQMRQARDASPRDPGPWWAWYDLQLVRNDPKKAHEAAKELARAFRADAAAQWAFLNSLANRTAMFTQVWSRGPGAQDKIPPLSAADLDAALASFETLRRRRPDWVEVNILTNVAVELKRAGRPEQAERFYRDSFAAADTVDAINDALQLAAERGDVAGCMALFDKYVRLIGNRTQPIVGGLPDPLDALSKVMAARAQEGAHADALKVLDQYLDLLRRRERVTPTSRARTPIFAWASNPGTVSIWVGVNPNHIQLDFPRPNDYFDYGAIMLLRNAYEYYKRDDLLSDLLAHVRAQVPADDAAGRHDARLLLGYLLWWDDEKDEAIAELAGVAEATRDAQLRLDLAEMRERRGEREAALALADSVEPMDQKTMQRRETLALRVAVLTGDVERARKAAERLFNLRLDTQTHLWLSEQMHQLGMHELAEAVLGRARRRAGNRTATLVNLMHQYQRQNKTDVAIQVALQVLRRTPTASANPFGNPNNEDNGARQQAILMLSRSGRLKELIARAEAQLKASPGSVGVLQILADYYRAAGESDKAKAAHERIAATRPDDAKFQYQAAQQLLADGDVAAALAHYRAALRLEPSSFGPRYWELQNAFQQAGKLDELLAMLDGTDLKAFASNPWMVNNLVQQLFQDPKLRDRALALFRKAWKAFPEQRPNLMNIVQDDALWQLPEMYDYARDVVIPDPERGPVTPWQGLETLSRVEAEGRAVGLVTRLLDVASRQGKLDPLAGEVEKALSRSPEWEGGRALLAMLDARRGRVEAAKRSMQAILKAHEKEPVPMMPAWVIGQEFESYAPTKDVALALYEGTVEDKSNDPNRAFRQLNFSPARRLIAIYRRDGRADEARALVARHVRRKPDRQEQAQLGGRLNFQQLNEGSQLFLELGYPVDAVRVYTGLLNDPDLLRSLPENTKVWLANQAEAILMQALGRWDERTIATALRELVRPGDAPPGSPILDLAILVHPSDPEHAAVASLFDEAVRSPRAKPELLSEVAASLAKLDGRDPKDLSVPIAAALVALAEGKPDAIDAALSRLTRRVGELPLEPLPDGARANARQRADAAKQLGLWLVARASWKHESSRPTGDALAARALEAARRQSDARWSLAMLREWGQVALDQGDRVAAERRWGQMLDLVLTDPGAKKSASPTTTTAVTFTTGVAPAVPPPPTPAARVGATTFERYGRAIQLSKLAATHGMPALSLRAAREALVGGPPIGAQPQQEWAGVSMGAMGGMTVIQHQPGFAIDPMRPGNLPQIEQALRELEALWAREKLPPRDVYEVLRDVVLPPSRPAEVFLYTQPIAQAAYSHRPRSVGALLARWAVRAGRVEDLRRRVEARRKMPMAELPAMVLTGQIALEAKDSGALAAALGAFDARLKKDTLANTAEMACQVALPALDGPSAGAALPVVERAAEGLATLGHEQPAGNLLFALARDRFAHRDVPAGRKHIRDYLALIERVSAQQGDYSSFRRKVAFGQAAAEYVRAGRLDDALDMMGQFADTPTSPRFGQPGVGNVVLPLLRMIAALPAPGRYETLKSWTMPEANRKSVRLLATTLPPDAPPAAFGVTPVGDGSDPAAGGVASSFGLMIDAARQLGRLDALADEAGSLAEQKVENADVLLVLVQVALGRGAAVEPRVRSLRDALARRWPKGQPDPNAMRGFPPRPIEWADFLVAEACTRDPALKDHGRAMLVTLLDQGRKTQHWAFQTLANRALALADLPDPAKTPAGPGLAHWHPSGFSGAWAHTNGAAPSWWAAQGGLIAHLSGPEEDSLFFDHPLTGTFEFSVDAYDGGWSESHVGYGGRIFEPMQHPQAGNVATAGRWENVPRAGTALRRDAFNRLTLRVEPGRVRLLVNGHLFHEDTDPSPTSPWLALFTKRERHSVWANPTLAGAPEIPPEVRLVHDDRLEGWISGYYNESIAPRNDRHARPDTTVVGTLAAPSYVVTTKAAATSYTVVTRAVTRLRAAPRHGGPARAEDYDWSCRDGVLSGRRTDESAGAETADRAIQSRLYYHRPLRGGESVTYEFLYEPGETMVYPALGRLAFLLEPDGVRLHWLTDGADNEWTGLAADNAADEPAGRRGPGRLPLKEGAWNSATLALDGDALVLSLNGAEVFRRPMEPDNDRLFGFFHYKDRTAVKVRNVVLKGDWPRAFAAATLVAMAAAADDKPDAAERRARHALIGERFFAMQAGDILRRARDLPAGERYDFLAHWVLPNADHPTLRLYGDAVPTDAAPPVARGPAHGDPPRRLHTGGELEFPAAALVAAAKESGKLDALADSVDKLDARTDADRRARLAMLALIRVAQEDDKAAALLSQLVPLVQKVADDTPDWERWPELAAAEAAIARPKLLPPALGLLNPMVEQVQKKSPSPFWERRVRHARALAQVGLLPEGQRAPFGTPPKSSEWTPVMAARASSRGQGDPVPHWTLHDHEAKHYPGHQFDSLYYNVPLRGDFEVNCELTSFNWREGRISYAGLTVALQYDLKRYDLLSFGHYLPAGVIDPPLKDIKDWYPFRLVVKDGTYTAFIGDRKIHEQRLPAEPDPWLTINLPAALTGGARNLRITGNPTVPERLNLSSSSDLAGWLADYYDEPTSGDHRAWEKRGEEIYGRLLLDEPPTNENIRFNNQQPPPRVTPGSKQESLLQYHRPLLEDGEITYEFYYEPGKSLTHPALDRLAFLLEPDGVKVHWLTDAQYDRTGLAPDNAAVEKDSRRGPDALPLKPNAWNRVKLSLAGDTATLALNDTVVYERKLEPTNQRFFGLFHYADETEVRVRNVVYKGDWPRKLPEVQELAKPGGAKP
jgi:tetratricopeptide (TPR) repeat protein